MLLIFRFYENNNDSFYRMMMWILDMNSCFYLGLGTSISTSFLANSKICTYNMAGYPKKSSYAWCATIGYAIELKGQLDEQNMRKMELFGSSSSFTYAMMLIAI
jgi:hypothetical protein